MIALEKQSVETKSQFVGTCVSRPAIVIIPENLNAVRLYTGDRCNATSRDESFTSCLLVKKTFPVRTKAPVAHQGYFKQWNSIVAEASGHRGERERERERQRQTDRRTQPVKALDSSVRRQITQDMHNKRTFTGQIVVLCAHKPLQCGGMSTCAVLDIGWKSNKICLASTTKIYTFSNDSNIF